MSNNGVSTISLRSKFGAITPIKKGSFRSGFNVDSLNNSISRVSYQKGLNEDFQTQGRYWPEYKKYSPYNDIKLEEKCDNLKFKINELMQFKP